MASHTSKLHLHHLVILIWFNSDKIQLTKMMQDDLSVEMIESVEMKKAMQIIRNSNNYTSTGRIRSKINTSARSSFRSSIITVNTRAGNRTRC